MQTMTTTSWPFQTNIRLSSYTLTMCFQGHGPSQRPFAFLRVVYVGEPPRALPALTKMLHNHLRLSGDCMQQTSQLINDGKHMHSSDMWTAPGRA